LILNAKTSQEITRSTFLRSIVDGENKEFDPIIGHETAYIFFLA
jgi:polyhydroxyalkanoate synthesis regulator protein